MLQRSFRIRIVLFRSRYNYKKMAGRRALEPIKEGPGQIKKCFLSTSTILTNRLKFGLFYLRCNSTNINIKLTICFLGTSRHMSNQPPPRFHFPSMHCGRRIPPRLRWAPPRFWPAPPRFRRPAPFWPAVRRAPLGTTFWALASLRLRLQIETRI